MKDESKTKARLIEELNQLRRKTAQLEARTAEHQLQEEALRSERNRWQTLVEESFDGIFVQKRSRIVLVNRRLCDMLGYDESELVGLEHWRVYHPDYQDLTRKRARARLSGKAAPSRYEVRLQRKDGSSFEGEISARAIVLEGEPGIQVWIRDITERKRTEEALRESEERLYSAMGAAADPFVIYDMDGRAIYVNPAFTQLFGWTADELLGKRIDFAPEDTKPQTERLIKRVLAGEQVSGFETRRITKSGEVIEISLSGACYRDRAGQPLGLVASLRDITDRKRAEVALRESEDRYRQLVEVSPDCVLVYQDEVVVFANPAAAMVLGAADQKQLLGKSVWEIVHPDYHHLATERISRVEKLDEVLPTVEYLYVRVDGRPVEVEARARRFTYQGRSALLSVFSDVTERKQKEAALKESERKYEAILDNIQEGYYEVDLAGNFTFFNDSTCRILGYSREEMTGMNYRYYSDEENARKVFAIFNRVYRTGQAAESLAWEITRSDGSMAFMETSVSLLQDAEGQPIGFRGVVRDVTERKRAEEALKDSEQRLTQIVNFLPDATFVIDLEGKVIAWNQAIEDMTGLKAEDILGKGDYEYAIPFYGDRRPVMIDLVIDRDPEIEAKYVSIKAEGDRLISESFIPGLKPGGAYLYNSARTLYDAEGRVVGAIESIRDVTDIKRAEEERAKLQVQLQQSQKMEAVGTLAGGIAHDFNNILAAVMGYTELALDNARKGSPCLEELERVLEAAERAKSLVQQILTFSRKVEAESKPMSLNQVVMHTAGWLERTIPKMIEIELRLADDLRAIQGDPMQIEQVLMNLGTNAVDAMPDGGKLLIETEDVWLGEEYCRGHMEVRAGQYVWLRVSDTGEGIDRETLGHIFDPFFTTKEVGRGTGLGLASVYGIVKDHGGHITCYSEVAKGTVFNIYLPALETGASDLATAADADEEIPGGEETILVVDDETPILDVARSLLERHGYSVVLSSSGEEAVQVYRERGADIDLVILDLGMPGMGGHKALGQLLEIDPEVKVVIASGYSVNGQVKNSLEAGAAGYIGKPYRLHDMLHKVRAVLDG